MIYFTKKQLYVSLKYLILPIFFGSLACDVLQQKINLEKTTYYDIHGNYVYFFTSGTLYYTNFPKTKDQYLLKPEDGFRVEYKILKNLDFRLFPIDLPKSTAMTLKLSKDLNRLYMFLGAPGDGQAYLLIKNDPKNERLLELRNVY